MTAKREPVTRPTGVAVAEFLAGVPEPRRGDAERLCALMGEVTGEPAAMWGPSIVGFGRYHYRYDSGHEGDAPLVSFAPRAQHLVIYLAAGLEARYPRLLVQLGPHRAGKGCLYVKRLDAVDEGVLRQLVERSVLVHKGVDRASS